LAVKPSLYTISGLQAELGVSARKLGEVLATIRPEGGTEKRPMWLIKTALQALNADEGRALNPQAEKARLDKARADLAELDLSVREGRLVPASAIEKAWANIATEVRTRLMSIPASTAPRITGKTTTVEIEAIIREQIDEALNAISGAVIVAEDDDQDAEQPGAVRRDGKGSRTVQGVTAT